MGMDVSGINPMVVGDKPYIDWSTSTDEERDAYFEAKDKYLEENPGVYFRASCWSWRPIMSVMENSGALDLLPDDHVDAMHMNDGAGARSKEQAQGMAELICLWIENAGWKRDGNNEEYWEPNYGADTMVEENGEVHSMYRVYRVHVEQWVTFLENCGDGFEVW
jgi:hypothetical protein